MRIQMTDTRERTHAALQEATGEAAKSKAIDRAAMFYTHMAGGIDAVPKGAFAELLEAADERGSLTAARSRDDGGRGTDTTVFSRIRRSQRRRVHGVELRSAVGSPFRTSSDR